MADDDDVTRCECPDDDGADDSAEGIESVPARYTDMAGQAEAEVSAAMQEVHAALAAQIADAEREIAVDTADMNIALASVVGQADSELRAAATPAFAALDRMIDVARRELILAEEELKVVGVAVPDDPAQKYLDLQDDTGTAIIERLMGVPYSGAQEVPSGTVQAPVSADDVGAVAGGGSGEPRPSGDIGECHCPSAGDNPLPAQVPPQPVGTVGAPVAPAVPAEAVTDGAIPPVPPVAPPDNLASPGGAPESVAPAPKLEFFDTFGALTPGAPTIPPPKPPANTFAGVAVRPTPTGGIEIDYDGLRWDRAQVCTDAAQTVDAKFRTFKGPVKGEPIEVGTASAVWRSMISAGRAFIDGALSGFDDKVKDESFAQSMSTIGDRFGGMSGAAQFLENLSETAVPDKTATWNIGIALALAHTAEDSSGFPTKYIAQSIEYLYQYVAPQFIPEQAALNEAYFSDIIGLEQWSCLTRAHGNLVEPAKWALQAQQARPAVPELIDLYRRGELTREKLIQRARERGVVTEAHVGEWLKLAEWVPSPPDVMRYMVRDVFDDDVVKAEGLDTDFELKLYGKGGRRDDAPAAKWLRAHGLDESAARWEWRAHWQAPSNTQVFDGLHRLREDRPEVKAWDRKYPQWTPGAPMPPDDPRPPVVTMDDARKLLQVNDMYPAWVERVLATSYLPMNATDAQAAFLADTMDAAELERRYLDIGYDRPTAARKVKIQVDLKARRVANLSGVWTIRKIVSAYKEGALTRFAADGLLAPQMTDAKQRADLLDGADAELDSDWRRAKLARIRRSYMVGETDEKKTVGALIGMNIGAQKAQTIVDKWTEEKNGRLREPTAMKIIKWVRQKIMTPDEGWERLLTLGYMATDARRMVYEGIIELNQDALTEQRRVEAERRRIIKDARQAKKEDRAELEKRLKELEKQQKDQQKERDRIQKELDARKP